MCSGYESGLLIGATLIFGGAGSGKRSYSESRAARFRAMTYIATEINHDDDSDRLVRIGVHQHGAQRIEN